MILMTHAVAAPTGMAGKRLDPSLVPAGRGWADSPALHSSPSSL